MTKKSCSCKLVGGSNGLIVLCCVLIVGWLVPVYAAQDLELPLLETTQFELLGTDDGRVQLTIKAAQMCQYENGNITLEGAIEIVLWGHKAEQGEAPIHIQADTLSYNKEQGLCMLAGNVLVSKPAQPLSICTDQLSYDTKEEKIFTECSIIITDKENVLKGSGLRATRDLTKYTILGPNGAVEIKQEAVPGG